MTILAELQKLQTTHLLKASLMTQPIANRCLLVNLNQPEFSDSDDGYLLSFKLTKNLQDIDLLRSLQFSADGFVTQRYDYLYLSQGKPTYQVIDLTSQSDTRLSLVIIHDHNLQINLLFTDLIGNKAVAKRLFFSNGKTIIKLLHLGLLGTITNLSIQATDSLLTVNYQVPPKYLSLQPLNLNDEFNIYHSYDDTLMIDLPDNNVKPYWSINDTYLQLDLQTTNNDIILTLID